MHRSCCARRRGSKSICSSGDLSVSEFSNEVIADFGLRNARLKESIRNPNSAIRNPNMSTPAKVHSSDAIEAVRLALLSFIERVTDALAELSGEMRRTQ
jgi:hypothetical protein